MAQFVTSDEDRFSSYRSLFKFINLEHVASATTWSGDRQQNKYGII